MRWREEGRGEKESEGGEGRRKRDGVGRRRMRGERGGW
jgi:hypothetical protein